MNKEVIEALNIVSNQVSSDYSEEIYTIRAALERPNLDEDGLLAAYQKGVEDAKRDMRDTIAVKREVLEKFINAKRKAEKILIDKTSENYSEWLSAFMHHVN